jgi:hypothetical protein
MESLDPVLAFLAKLAAAGGGLVVIAYGIFKFFGAKWLEARFSERLQNLKSEQDQAIRHVQSAIDREVHRAKKLYDREFDVLSDCWAKLSRAFDTVCATVSERYHDFQRLTEKETRNLLKELDLRGYEVEDVLALQPDQRTEKVRTILQWRRLSECFKLRHELSATVALNGPFMSRDLRDRFFEIDKMIVAALVEFQMRLDLPFKGDFDKVVELRQKGQPLVDELEILLRERFWSASGGVVKSGP